MHNSFLKSCLDVQKKIGDISHAKDSEPTSVSIKFEHVEVKTEENEQFIKNEGIEIKSEATEFEWYIFSELPSYFAPDTPTTSEPTCNDTSKVQIYPSGTKKEDNLDSHLNLHSCKDFQSSRKTDIHKHTLIHEAASKEKPYKCTFCHYRFKIRCRLKTHMITHMDPSELKMYGCHHCSYQTKWKNTLSKHVLKQHKFQPLNEKRIVMHHCRLCDYKSTHKYDVYKHMLVHSAPSPVQMLQCPLCDFRAKSRMSIVKHLVGHSNQSKVSCGLCDYQSQWQGSLTKHVKMAHKGEGGPS